MIVIKQKLNHSEMNLPQFERYMGRQAVKGTFARFLERILRGNGSYDRVGREMAERVADCKERARNAVGHNFI